MGSRWVPDLYVYLLARRELCTTTVSLVRPCTSYAFNSSSNSTRRTQAVPWQVWCVARWICEIEQICVRRTGGRLERRVWDRHIGTLDGILFSGRHTRRALGEGGIWDVLSLGSKCGEGCIQESIREFPILPTNGQPGSSLTNRDRVKGRNSQSWPMGWEDARAAQSEEIGPVNLGANGEQM